MLDVHPPHKPAHTWRDFFIHIATIVIGCSSPSASSNPSKPSTTTISAKS